MVVDRDETMARLAKLSAATLQHKPSQRYTVADRIEERTAAHPDRPFIVYGERSVSYRELNAVANRVAHAAHGLGLRCGEVAALVVENRPEFVSSWTGLAKLGVVTALINTNARGAALRHALEVTGARHVLVGSECLAGLDTIDECVRDRWAVHVLPDPDAGPAPDSGAEAGEFSAELVRMSTENPDPSLRDDLIAGNDLFHVFTSGTTGLPKAARLSHMRYLGVGDGMSAVAGYGPDDAIACVLPLYHGAGVMVVVSCALSQGARVVLRRRFSASAFWDEARRYGVTAFQYIGEICRYLLNQPPRSDDRDHRVRVMMGAGLGADIWETFQQRFGIERILEGWSSTEANTSLINVDGRVGSCGRIPHKDLHNGRLVRYDVETDRHPKNADGTLIECESGEVGEFIGMIPELPDSGAGRFEGYTDAEATQRKILRDVFRKGDAWYRSGDLLRRDEDDYYCFVDRIGDTFRWKSENVSTQEVAELLSGFPGVEVANVYGVRVPHCEGRAGMAALALTDPEAFDGRAFFEHCASHLPAFAAPLFLRLSKQADTTSTFKLRKVDLRRDGYDPTAVADPLFVRNEARDRYVRLDGASLRELGIAPFEVEGARRDGS